MDYVNSNSGERVSPEAFIRSGHPLNIFITGQRQVGKSTLINRALNAADVKPCGFRTVWEDNELYIRPADGSSRGQVTARRSPGISLSVYREVFEGYGAELIRSSVGKNLILMDELGFMESSAPEFQRAVFEAIESDTPVLGVLRAQKSDFLNTVAEHQNVSVIELSEANRDIMLSPLCEWLLSVRSV